MGETSAATSGGGQRQFPCRQCGASLVFAPGTEALTCGYCGAVNEVPREVVGVGGDGGVQELDFRAALAKLPKDEPTQEVLAVKCQQCGAESTLSANVVAEKCPFCGTGIVAVAGSKKQIKPRCVLPFHVTREQAVGSFRAWISSRWFAPSALKKEADKGRIDGVYLPAWTYDADCATSYVGERGDDYWDSETYTAMENGRSVTRTRQVRKTRWRGVSGAVDNVFDDVLVMGTDALPGKYLAELQPWDLTALAGYRDEYLSGFRAMSYDVDLHDGFGRARQIMDGVVQETIRRDIGGDHQRIGTYDTRFGGITFKHILLPVWLSAYQYGGKTFRFMVNARTGEVQGERPYSAGKIAVAVVVGILVLLVVLMVMQGR